MATGTTTYGDINQRTAAYAAVEFLSHATPVLVLQQFGQIKELPKNKADTIKFRRTIPFGPATVPLQEGVTPSARKMEFEDVEAQLRQYGDVVEITDVVEDLSEDPVLREAMTQCGEQAGATFEQLAYGKLKAATNVFFANGSALDQVNTEITLNKQRSVTRSLSRNKAKRITRILDGSVKVGTRPVEAAYVAVTHTDVEDSLRGLTGFKTTAEYGSRKPLDENEVGSVEKVRYITSPDLQPLEDAGGAKGSSPEMLSTSGVNADVYPILYFGQEAFGIVPLAGKRAVTPTVVNKKPSDSDPLAQRTKVGWKAYFTAVILNQAWMARLMVAVEKL